MRWGVLAVAGREVVGEVEASVAGCAGLGARAACHTSHHRVRVRRDAVRGVDYLDERVRLDEHLIASLHVRVSRFQVEDEVRGCIRASRRSDVKHAALGINARTREREFDVFRKRAATRDVWSGVCQTETLGAFPFCVNAILHGRGAGVTG